MRRRGAALPRLFRVRARRSSACVTADVAQYRIASSPFRQARPPGQSSARAAGAGGWCAARRPRATTVPLYLKLLSARRKGSEGLPKRGVGETGGAEAAGA